MSTFSSAARRTLTVHLTSAGRRQLERHRSIKLVAQESFFAACGTRASVTRTFALWR